MKSKWHKRFSLLSVPVFTCGLGLFLWVQATGQGQSASARKPFMMVIHEYEVENGQPGSVKRIKTAAVNPQAGFKITAYDLSNGQSKITVGNQIASYVVKDNALQFLSQSSHINEFNQNSLSESFFRSNPLFAREDIVCGMKVFVLHSENSDTSFDDYYSPQTGWFALKRVTTDKATKSQKIEEAISVQFRDLAENEYQMPKLPVRFDDAQQLISSLRASGQPNNLRQADHMSQKMEEVKNKLGIK